MQSLKEYQKYIQSLNKIYKTNIFDSLSELPEKHWQFSSITREPSIFDSQYNFNISNTNSIVANYKLLLRKAQGEYYVIYNTIVIEIQDNRPVVKYICPSASMRSKDGEYRSNVLHWPTLRSILSRPEFKKIFSFINDYIKTSLLEREYVIIIEKQYPTDDMKNKYQFETEIITNSIKNESFTLMWFNFYFSYYFGFISNNLNVGYKNLLLLYKKEDYEFFEKLVKKFSIECVDQLRYILNNNLGPYYSNLKDIPNIKDILYQKRKFGQKTIPLTLSEAQYFFDITYDPWKEYFINMKITELITDRITNGFSLQCGWFIQKINDNTFDNPVQKKRFDKSKVALRIADLLFQARLYTFAKPKFLEDIILELNIANKEASVSRDFKPLYYDIGKNVDFLKSNLILSNVGLTFINEFIGETFYDAILLSKKSRYYRMLVQTMFSQENSANFKKYIFQLCYNIYCFNEKLNIIHGDLHMNNITLNPSFYKKNVKLPENPKILYIINPESDIYVFEQNFYDLSIIDFSKSIVHIEKYEQLLKNSKIPKQYTKINSKDKFQSNQAYALINYFIEHFPDFYRSIEILRESVKYNFDLYFKVLSCLDIYSAIDKFTRFIKKHKDKIGKCYQGSMELLNNISKQARSIIIENINKLIKNKTEDVEKMEWPIQQIIKSNFHSFKYSSDMAENIIDVYSFNPAGFKQFPISQSSSPYLSKMQKELANMEKQNINNFKIIDFIMKRQKEKYIQTIKY